MFWQYRQSSHPHAPCKTYKTTANSVPWLLFKHICFIIDSDGKHNGCFFINLVDERVTITSKHNSVDYLKHKSFD